MSFEGKNALVTGSSKGIGAAVALELARQGANVVVNCHSSRDQADKVAEQIRELGRKALVVTADVSSMEAVDEMVQQTVAEFGSLDLFVSNAVYSDREVMLKADMTGFRRTVDVSMWGAFHGVRAASIQMVQQGRGGAITVISSPHAIIPFPTAMAYNMSKAAIDHMARTAAIELVKYNIRVNIFHPGWIDTPGERKFFTEEQLQQGAQGLPMKRMGTAEEMARGVCFTLSDDAAYMTGSTLTMDGGVGLPWWSKREEGGQ
ncbi:MAG: SDR family oxidoreductase [Planctomycetaceae bacterium]|nr:SDR family oxidoreductase [Planctomycetaceae bacterium]